ncbi:MAG: hypothetical protein JWN23_620 [Rhodocyclales bacterium]|nr:hypothetical protein [Rhodocyclales bacterium]
MTTPETARFLALIAAAQARIAGMQAANDMNKAVCGLVRYSEKDFHSEAFGLEQIAIQVINQ